MAPRGHACAAAATLLLGVAAAACFTVAPTATTLCHSQAAPVSGGAYRVNNNQWASSAAQCINTDGNARFTVTHSAIDNRASSAPGGYPFIYTGCHWGVCTARSGLPIQVSRIGLAGYLDAAGFDVTTVEPHNSAVAEMAGDVQGRLLGIELMVKLKKLDLPGADFEQAKHIARAAGKAIQQGLLGYSLIVARLRGKEKLCS